MRVFLSHASADKSFVRAVQAALPPHVRTWLDVQELYAGHELRAELRQAVFDDTDYVVLFVSPRALDSEWVARELGWAIEREADLGRPFVVPVFLADTPAAAPAAGALAPMWSRIHIRATDDANAAAAEVARHLFALVSDWIEKTGDSSRKRFITRLRADLTEFKDRAYLMVAAMGASIEMMASHEEAHATFANCVTAYVSFSDDFIGRKDALRAQAHELFGGYVAAQTDQTLAFIESKVYRGHLFDLNAIVDDVNAFERSLKSDALALAAAQDRKQALLAKAQQVLQQMTKRSLALIDMLQTP